MYKFKAYKIATYATKKIAEDLVKLLNRLYPVNSFYVFDSDGYGVYGPAGIKYRKLKLVLDVFNFMCTGDKYK